MINEYITMDNRKNDMFAIMLNQPEATFEDMILHGVTADNTGIKDRDYYKNIDAVVNNDAFKGDDGKFSEVKFNNFYDSVVSVYNTFSKDDYEKKLLESFAKDPLDWTQPLKTNVKDISAVIVNGTGEFGRRAKSITGIGHIGDPVFSMREIAQNNEVRDMDGNGLGFTPNTMKLFKSIFAPTYVLATYDENGTHEENGKQVAHKKGEYKLIDGDPYYEELGNRASYGKEVLRFSDTITVDGTPLNKWDIWDSDGIDKSIGKTIAQTISYVAPLLIPGTSAIWGTLGLVGGLASSMPTLLKGVSGILGDHDSPYVNALTQTENWVQRWKPTQSDAAKGKFMSFENMGEIIRSSATQLFSQRQVANISQFLLKGGDNMLAASKTAQGLSLGYMALTSSTDTYAAFKDAGASDAVAGLGMLATMGALYGLMNTNYFKDALFKGTWLDESEVNNVIKNYSKENIARLAAAEATAVKPNLAEPIKNAEEAATLFSKIQNGIQKGWKKFVASPLSGTPKDLTTANNAGKKFKTLAGIIINRSVNEGFEETVEEVSQDLVKALFKGCEALGMDMTSNDAEELSFGWSPSEALQRYVTSFGGGFFGGMVFEGITQYENKIYNRPTIANLKDVNEQMLYLILSGHGDEIKEKARLYRNKGLLGNKNLSIKNVKEKVDEKGNKTYDYSPASGLDNQNDFAYNLIVHEVDRLTHILDDAGITNNLVKRYLSEFGGNFDGIEGFDNELTLAIKKLQMHTTFMDDLVELAGKIVSVQSQLDKLNENVPNDKKEEEKPSKEKERLQKLLQDLLKQRDAFFNHENDKEYIDQALFIADGELQKTLVNSITGVDSKGKTDANYSTGLFEGESGFSNYMLLKYHINVKDLTTGEKQFYRNEYDTYMEKDNNILEVQAVGKTLFKLFKATRESLNPLLQKAEEELKDTVDNPFYVHFAHYKSPEYEKYKNNKITIVQQEALLKQLHGKLEYLDPNSEESEQIRNDIIEAQATLDDARQAVDDYELIHPDEIQSQFAEIATSELGQAFQSRLQSFLYGIKSANRIIDSNASEEEKAQSRVMIQNQFSKLTDEILGYLGVLKEDNIIDGSETELLINRVIGTAFDIIENLSDASPEEWINDYSDVPILSTLMPDYIMDEGISNHAMGWLDNIKQALQSGDSQSIIDAFELIKTDLQGDVDWQKNENGHQVQMTDEEIASEINRVVDGIQKFLFGTNLTDFLKTADDLRKSIKHYGVVDILQNMSITVDDDVRSALEFIEEQKKSLLKSKDLESFALRPGAKEALTKIKALLNFAQIAIQAASDGYNHYLNLIPGKEGDIKFAEISQNTKNRLVEDLIYLNSVVDTLLDINAKNEFVKEGYAEKSEVYFHKSFMETLLTGDINNPATWLGKFKNKFNVNLKDIWEKTDTGKRDNYTDLSTQDRSNYVDFKKRFIAFWKQVRAEILANTEVSNNSLQKVGELLGEMLEPDAKLGNYGEINAGQYLTDETKNKPTNLQMIIVSGALLNEDYEEFYKTLSEAVNEEDYPYTPLMQQELATLISYQFAKNQSESVFPGILNAIKDKQVELPESISDKDKKEVHWSSLGVLENIFWIQGGTGSGKTTAVSTLTYKMLKKDAEKQGKNIEVVVAAPTATQLEPYSELLNIPKERAFLQSELIDKIGGSANGTLIYNGDIASLDDDSKKEKYEIKGDETTGYINSSVTPDGEIDALFKEDDSIKYIFVDEAQFLNAGSLQLLDKWAQAHNIKVLLYGDKNQNGATIKVNNNGTLISSENNIADLISLSCPSLGESLRFANAAKEDNYKSLKGTLDAIQDAVSAEFEYRDNKTKDIAARIIDERVKLGLPIKLKYFEDENTFVGEKIINGSDIQKYIDKFKALSTPLHGGVPSVCVIVGDPNAKTKYNDPQITVLTAAEVQGREYDFVVIGKDFNSENKLLGLKDVYTLVGRSKIGSVIASDLSALSISNDLENSSKGLATAINDEGSFEKYAKFKQPIYGLVNPNMVEKTPQTEETPAKSEESQKPLSEEEALDEIFKEGDYIEEGVQIEPPKNVLIESNNEGTFDQIDETVKEFKQEVQDQKNKRISSLKTNGRVAADWNRYVEWVQSDSGLLANETCIGEYALTAGLSDFEKSKMQTLFRKFASASIYNIKLQRHHIATLKSLAPEKLKGLIGSICSKWNDEKEHTFIAYANNEGTNSIIYWRASLSKDIVKYIPIAVVEGSLSGQTTVSRETSIFKKAEEFWALCGRVKEGKSISKVSVEKVGKALGVTSKPRILAIKKEAIDGAVANSTTIDSTSNGEDTKKWLANNTGHSFSLVSDCEILEEEDFNEIFKIAKENGSIVHGFSVKSVDHHRLDDDKNKQRVPKNRQNVTMHVKVGGSVIPVLDVNTHHYVDLATLYNLANIGRFAAGQIEYRYLTTEQQKLIGEDSITKAQNIMKEFLGAFTIRDPRTSEVAERLKNNAFNARALAYTYKLLSPEASYAFLGSTFSALYKLSKEDIASKDSYEYFREHLLTALVKKGEESQSRSGLIYRNKILISVPSKGEPGRRSFLLSIDAKSGENTKHVVTIHPLKYDKVLKKFVYSSTTPINIGKTEYTISEINFENLIKSCIQYIGDDNGFGKNSDEINTDELFDALGTGRIQLSLMQSLQRRGQEPRLYLNNDYNTVATVINSIISNGNDRILSKLENRLLQTSKFIDGFTLNENRQISEGAEASRKSSLWAISQMPSRLAKSNLESIEGSIWEVSADFSHEGAPILDLYHGSSFKLNQDNVSIKESDYNFKLDTDKKIEWDGNVLNLTATVDNRWLSKFISTPVLDSKNNEARIAKLKQIDFNDGTVKLSVGTSTLTVSLKNKNISPAELSNGVLKNRNIFTSPSGISYEIREGKVYSEDILLNPLFKYGDAVYFASADGKIDLVLDSNTPNLNIDTKIPKMKIKIGDVFIDNSGNFYTAKEFLGKPINFDNLNKSVIFENISIPYDAKYYEYLSKAIQNEVNGENIPKSKYKEEPSIEFKKNLYIDKVNGVLLFYDECVKINGAWLGSNTNYDGGDGTFTIRKIEINADSKERIITLTNGNSYNLTDQQAYEDFVNKSAIGKSNDFLKKVILDSGVNSDQITDIIESEGSIESKIDSINIILDSIGRRLEYNKDLQTLRIVQLDPNKALVDKYCKDNSFTLSEEPSITVKDSLNNNIIIFNAIDNNQNEVSIYINNGLIKVGIKYQDLQDFIGNLFTEDEWTQISGNIHRLRTEGIFALSTNEISSFLMTIGDKELYKQVKKLETLSAQLNNWNSNERCDLNI